MPGIGADNGKKRPRKSHLTAAGWELDANSLVKYITFARRRISTRLRAFGTFHICTLKPSVYFQIIYRFTVNAYGNYNAIVNKKTLRDFNNVFYSSCDNIISLIFKKRRTYSDPLFSFVITDKKS